MSNDALTKLKDVRVKDDTERQNDISFLLVPATSSLPFQELILTSDEKSTSDPMLDVLEPYFELQPGEKVNMAILQKQADAEREAGCATGMCSHVSPAVLQSAAEAGTLEKVKISDDVYMYLDESANLKERPVNERAKQYTKNTTYEEETIHGDVFLARIQNQKLVSLSIQDLQNESWFAQN